MLLSRISKFHLWGRSCWGESVLQSCSLSSEGLWRAGECPIPWPWCDVPAMSRCIPASGAALISLSLEPPLLEAWSITVGSGRWWWMPANSWGTHWPLEGCCPTGAGFGCPEQTGCKSRVVSASLSRRVSVATGRFLHVWCRWRSHGQLRLNHRLPSLFLFPLSTCFILLLQHQWGGGSDTEMPVIRGMSLSTSWFLNSGLFLLRMIPAQELVDNLQTSFFWLWGSHACWVVKGLVITLCYFERVNRCFPQAYFQWECCKQHVS